MFAYNIGGIKIESESINDLKDLAEQLNEMSKESGMDLPKHLSDTCFAIETDYQAYHGLDENCWDVVH